MKKQEEGSSAESRVKKSGNDIEQEWLDADQTARYLSLPSRDIVYQMVRAGELPSYHLGKRRLRFKKSEINRMLESNRSLTLADLGVES